jgi:hypothetical protein
MVPAGDPLEPRFKMTVGTAQAGDPFLRRRSGAAAIIFEPVG